MQYGERDGVRGKALSKPEGAFRGSLGGMKRTSRRPRRNPSPLDNPAFRRWFGTSKVVDERGEPLVVYHGTNAPAFDVFDVTRGAGFFGTGIYVTPDKRAAEDYGESVIALYAKAEKPIDLTGDADAAMSRLLQYGVEAPYKNLRTMTEYEVRARKLREDILAAGFDSALIETADGVFGWVLFHAGQVKSATDNVGTYDPDDPSILKNRRASRRPRRSSRRSR